MDNLQQTEPEIAVFSLLLNYPDLVFSLNGVHNYMMSSNIHRNLMSIMEDIKERGLSSEISMVTNFATNLGKLDSIGGVKYLEHLKSQKYARENFGAFVKSVIDHYKYRVFLETVSGINPNNVKIATIDNDISKLQSNLDKLLTNTGGEGTYSMGVLLRDSFNAVMDRVNNPGVRGNSTGLSKVDLVTGGFDKGDLWYIGARPGMGKSSFISCTALFGARMGIPSLIFSREMTRQPLMERFMSLDTGIPLADIRRGTLKKSEVEVLRESAKRMMDYPIFIDLNFTGSIEQIESTIRKYLSLYNTKVVYVDYIQLLSERDYDQTQELGRISRKLKLLANQLGITMVTLSQLSREVEHRDNKRPIMADLRQCGNLEEDADYVIGLYRDEIYNKDTKDVGKLEFIVLKQRNGPVGMVKLGFDGTTTLVRED